MPIYEYRCDEGHQVELMQSIKDDALAKCPECGAPTRRVLHSPAIHFKGSGFHNTDYGTRSSNKAKQAAAAAKKEAGADSKTSDSKSSDSGSSSDSKATTKSSDSSGSSNSGSSNGSSSSSGSSSSD